MLYVDMMDYSNLSALFINCTLKRSPEVSNTSGLIRISKQIMEDNGVKTEELRLVDYQVAEGVYPDMREKGFDRDDWPELFEKVSKADILVIGSPIWLGEKSSICAKLIERLYAMSGKTNKKGQYVYYGKVGGCLITGNEDGAKHCSMSILYSLQHLGFLIPPQADAYWVGEAGPGPSYMDDESFAQDNNFTNRNTAFMSWNLMHMANILQASDGIPAFGNQRKKWDAGFHPSFPNPEYR